MKQRYILGIDGGGSNTTAVIFDDLGKTIAVSFEAGTNLSVYEEIAVKRVISIIIDVCSKANLDINEILGFGIALAGISNLNYRELLLKELDKLGISSTAIVLSDAEAAYRLLCPSGNGVLLSIGTGIICIAKDKDKIYKIAGKGHENGDLGSGYWIGKQIFRHLLLNANILSVDNDLKVLFDLVKVKFNISDIASLNQILDNNDNLISDVASISEIVIKKAEEGNDLALSVVQEGTTYVSDYINYIFDDLNYSKEEVIIACNGSVIKNNFYRKLLSQALQFDFKNIHWVFSDLSSAYGAGLMVADINKIKIPILELNKGKE